MSLEIYELRAEELPEAEALWSAVAEATATIAAARALPGTVALVGRDGGKLVVVAVCVVDKDRGHEMRVAVDAAVAADQAEALRRSISGVAMRKLRARGVTKCHISVDTQQQADPFFASLRYHIPGDPPSTAA